MNDENGLPAEVRKFIQTHLRTESERNLFLAEYRRLSNERERRAFLDRYAEEPSDEEHEANLKKNAARRRASRN